MAAVTEIEQALSEQGYAEITSVDDLDARMGRPSARAATKVRRTLHELDRQWLNASPFLLMATSDAEGNLDVSPKGDPGGFVHVLDDTRIVVPDRPGNRRADGFHNILANPKVGLLFLVPGRADTLRINGRARLVADAPFFDDLVVQGHRPDLAVVVDIDEVFYHCAKAFMRALLWQPDSWQPGALPSRAEISRTIERPTQSLAELERYYGPSYADGLYRPAANT